jgi:C-terminal processing protease CtpA/Prc
MTVLSALLLMLLAGPAPKAEVRPGWVGLTVTSQRNEQEQWLVVEAMAPGGPAERAGFRKDDVITRIDGKPLRFADDMALLDFLGRIKPGQKIRWTVRRDGTVAERDLVAAAMSDAVYERWKANVILARQAAEAAKSQHQ